MKSEDNWMEVEKAISALEIETDHPIQPTALGGVLFRMLKVQRDIAKINDETSARVVRLTWALLLLTGALVVVALVQTAMMIVGK